MIAAVVVGLLVAAGAWFVGRPLLVDRGTGAPEEGPRGPRFRLGRRATIAVLVAAAVVGAALAGGLAHPRRSGSGVRPAAASAPVPQPTSTAQLTDEQLAAIAVATAAVQARPRDVTTHLELARAYADAGEGQRSTVEYLAVLQLDPANPEAGSALALVALAAGQPTEGKQLVDAVLAEHPRYPDALYTRGVIYLMGLHKAAPGIRDLRAYLAAAPYGGHRDAARTLLAMVSDGRTP